MAMRGISILTLLLSSFICQAQITEYPYFIDFRDESGGFTANGESVSWEWSQFLKYSSNYPYDQRHPWSSLYYADRGWVTGSSYGFNSEEDSYIESPTFDLSGFADDPVLLFSAAFDLNDGNSFLIELSIDDGVNWSILGSDEDPDWYSKPTHGFEMFGVLPYGSPMGFNGYNELQRFAHALSGTAGEENVKLRFRLVHDGFGVQGWGVFLQSLNIQAMSGFQDLSITPILPEVSSVNGSATPLSIAVKNIGAAAMMVQDVHVLIESPDGAEVDFIESIDQLIPVAGDVIIPLVNTMDLSQIGIHEVRMFAEVPGDMVSSNNIETLFTGTVDNYAGLPFFPNFDGVDVNGYNILSSRPVIPGALPTLIIASESYAGTSYAGSYGLSLDANFWGDPSKSGDKLHAIFNHDLTSFSVSNDPVRLVVNVTSYQDEIFVEFPDDDVSLPDNLISVRGTVSDDWLPLIQWDTVSEPKFGKPLIVLDNINEVMLTAGQEFSAETQLRFTHQGVKENMTLSDLHLLEKPDADRDLGITTIQPPSMSPFLDSEEVIVSIANTGHEESTNIPVHLIVTHPDSSLSVFSEIMVGPVSGGDTVEYSIANVDLSVGGNYGFTASISDFSDALFNWNGTIVPETMAVTSKLQAYEGELPYVQNFNSLSPNQTIRDIGSIEVLPGWHFLGSPGANIYISSYTPDGNYALLRTNHDCGGASMVFMAAIPDDQDQSIQLNLDYSFVELANSYEYNENAFALIKVRSKADDPWLTLAEVPSTHEENELQFISLPITEVLEANEQSALETFQLGIEIKGNSFFGVENFEITTGTSMLTSGNISYQDLDEGFLSKSLSIKSLFNYPMGLLQVATSSEDNSIVQIHIKGDSLVLSEGSTIGTSLMTVSATATNGQETQTTFTVAVGVMNHAPSILELPDPIALKEGFEKYLLDVSNVFQDADDDVLYYSANVEGPEIVEPSVVENQLILLEKTNGSTEVTLEVDDEKGGTVSVLLSVIVQSNSAPELMYELKDLSLSKGFGTREIALTDLFNDVDGDNILLSVSSEHDSVITTSVDVNTDILILEERGLGTSKIIIEANDGFKKNETSFEVATLEPNNHPPYVISSLPKVKAKEGFEVYEVNLSHVFQDDDGDVLSYVVNVGDSTITDASIENSTLLLSEKSIGVTDIMISAHDGLGGVATTEFKLHIVKNNPPSILETIENQVHVNGFDTYEINLQNIFDDPDGDVISYHVQSSQESVVITLLDVKKQVLKIKEMSNGVSMIEILAYDGVASTEISFFFTVEAKGEVPLLLEGDIQKQSVFPNPTHGNYFFLHGDLQDTSEIQLFDIHGKRIELEKWEQTSHRTWKVTFEANFSGIIMLQGVAAGGNQFTNRLYVK